MSTKRTPLWDSKKNILFEKAPFVLTLYTHLDYRLYKNGLRIGLSYIVLKLQLFQINFEFRCWAEAGFTTQIYEVIRTSWYLGAILKGIFLFLWILEYTFS